MNVLKPKQTPPTALREAVASQQEVRCAVRFPLALPVVLWVDEEEAAALTRNVSASGVLFELDRPVGSGAGDSIFLAHAGRGVSALPTMFWFTVWDV